MKREPNGPRHGGSSNKASYALAEAQLRHGEYYLGLITRHAEDWQRIDQVYGQVKHAWAAGMDDGTRLNYVWALEKYQVGRGLWRDREKWIQRALQTRLALDSEPDRGKLLCGLGEVNFLRGRLDEARDKLEEALGIARETGDRCLESKTLHILGGVLRIQGHPLESTNVLEEAAAIHRDTGNRAGEAETLRSLSQTLHYQGRFSDSVAKLETALAIFGELGDTEMEAPILNSLGEVYFIQGLWESATASFESSLHISRERGDLRGEASTLNRLGVTLDRQGRWDDARDVFEDSLTISRQIDDRYLMNRTLNNLGVNCQMRGQWDESLGLFEASLRISQDLGHLRSEAIALLNMYETYIALGREQEASQALAEGCDICEKLDDQWLLAYSQEFVGDHCRFQGLWADAIQHYKSCIRLRDSIRDVQGKGESLRKLGQALLGDGDLESAQQALEQSLHICRELADAQREGMALIVLGQVNEKRQDRGRALTCWRTALEKLNPQSPLHGEVVELLGGTA